MIPKIIHQTWRSESSLRDSLKRCIETVKFKNPDFEYRFYNDKDCFDFIKKKFPEYNQVYSSLTLVERADLFRYLIVYEYGGVYLDVDCYCVKGLSGLIKGREFVAGLEQGWKEDDTLRYNQWAFAAKAKHPLLLQAALECKTRHLKNATMFTLKKTGPTMWTQIINKFKKPNNLSLGDDKWFGGRVYGINVSRKSRKVKKEFVFKSISKDIIDKNNIYILHLFLGSWHSGKKSEKETIAEIRAIEHMLSL